MSLPLIRSAPTRATSSRVQGYVISGDLADAYSAFKNAGSVDPADAEAAIYAEDLRISQTSSPFVTVIVGTAFDPNADPSDIDAARSELQGVYLAQHHINSANLLPDGVKLRVVVLNSGVNPAGATTAANAFLQEMRNGNTQHFVGIIGWPELAQTQLALAVLKPSGLPFISPTGGDDSLTSTLRHRFFGWFRWTPNRPRDWPISPYSKWMPPTW